ncbi:WD40 repeat-like protein [Schizopora paradoxa]|uniref:WD40 repeat-like protein n=1 Tax=Schizopora paradoxa TaxID=27342 RepID=A0A0H2R2N5_9AGAM|nr:WD40 repeat-like protein [Schizopora paradoxa]
MTSFGQRHVLALHSAPITSLIFSQCGNWLASGGEDGFVGIWKVLDGQLEQKLDLRIGGAISHLCWLSTPSRHDEHIRCLNLVIATSDTRIRLWSTDTETETDRLKLKPLWAFTAFHASRDQVECMAVSEFGSRHLLAVVGGTNLVLYSLEGAETVKLLVTEDFQATARTVHFTDGGATLVVGFLESRELLVWQVEPWEKRMHVELNTRIGHSAWSPEYRTLAVANLVNGVDLYQQLEPPVWNKTLTRSMVINNVKQVAFCNHGRLVVSGGDIGRALVWNRADGEVVQMLDHNTELPIQIIATGSTSLGHTIATGESGGSCSVFLWSEGLHHDKPSPVTRRRWNRPLRDSILVSSSVLLNVTLVILAALLLHFLDISGYLSCINDTFLYAWNR